MMRRIWTVASREVRAYFDQPTAYVLIVAFLVLSLFLTFRTIYATSVATLRPLFDLLPLLFAVFIPAVTMRALAEERRSKTLEWLLAQPLTEAEMVVGKFLGDWMFVSIALAGTLPTAVGLVLVSETDPGIMVAQYVGALLLAGQLVALGLWASSLTRNQITAFIVAAGSSFLLFLIGTQIVQIGLPPAISGPLGQLSVLGHFENVARGVVDLRDVLYFVSTGALFLTLAVGSIGRERLSHERAEYRRLRVGALVVALLVIVLNLLGSFVRGRLDLTSGDLYTLADGTRELLGGLDDIVQVKLFASGELPPEVQLQLRDVRDLLGDMRRAAGGNLIVTEIDPEDGDEERDEAQAYGVYPIEFNVLRDDELQIRRGYYGLVVEYAGENAVTPVIERTDDLEFRLASQIAQMTTEERPGLSFLTSSGGEPAESVVGLRESLADRYEIGAVTLAGDSVPPIDRATTEVLVIAGVTQRVGDAALERIREFLEGGGSALIMLEPVRLTAQTPFPSAIESGLEPLLSEKGIEVAEGMIADLSSNERVQLGSQGPFNLVAAYPLWPVLRPASDHVITRGLGALTLGWGTELRVTDSTAVVPLWQTSPRAGLFEVGMPIEPNQEWGFEPGDLMVRTAAAAVQPPEGAPGGRMVVVGDATFYEGQFVQANPANLAFIANSIDWLAQDEALLRIRAKNRTPPQLTFGSDGGRNALKWGNLVGVPLLFALFGAVRVGGRRRRAEARWREVVS